MTQNNPKYKILQQVVDAETYRTDTSTLLAYDESNSKYLFRALNSNYFLQNDNNESIQVIGMKDAEKVWEGMPSKYISNIIAAFPKFYGKYKGTETPRKVYV